MNPPGPSPRKPSSDAGTAIALVGVFLISSVLLGLMAMVLPQVAGVVLVVMLVFVLPIMFHYFVWGRWLSRMKEPEEERSNDRP